jgi:CRP-like cAMP-binding protein
MARKDEKLELLRRIPLFAGLNRRQIERLGQLTDEVDIPAGRVLMRQGDRGDELFIVVEGELRIERDGRSVAVRMPGDFVGEIALVDHGPRTATVTAAQPTRVLVVGHRAFNTLMDEFPGVRLEVLRALAQRVRAAEPEAAH